MENISKYTDKLILKFCKLNSILLEIFRLILQQTEFRLVPNQSKKWNYNPNTVWFNKIQNQFFFVYNETELHVILQIQRKIVITII